MKKKLTILNRFTLAGMLPLEGTITDMRITKDIRSNVDFSQKEIAEYGITTEDNRMKWDPDKSEETKEFTFSKLEKDQIKNRFDELNEKGKINEPLLDLYDKLFG